MTRRPLSPLEKACIIAWGVMGAMCLIELMSRG